MLRLAEIKTRPSFDMVANVALAGRSYSSLDGDDLCHLWEETVIRQDTVL